MSHGSCTGATNDTSSTRSCLIETVPLSESNQNLLQYRRELRVPTVWLVQNIAAQMDIVDPVTVEALLQTLSGTYTLIG